MIPVDDDARIMYHAGGAIPPERRHLYTHVGILSYALWFQVCNNNPSAVSCCISWFEPFGRELADYGDLK